MLHHNFLNWNEDMSPTIGPLEITRMIQVNAAPSATSSPAQLSKACFCGSYKGGASFLKNCLDDLFESKIQCHSSINGIHLRDQGLDNSSNPQLIAAISQCHRQKDLLQQVILHLHKDMDRDG